MIKNEFMRSINMAFPFCIVVTRVENIDCDAQFRVVFKLNNSIKHCEKTFWKCTESLYSVAHLKIVVSSFSNFYDMNQLMQTLDDSHIFKCKALMCVRRIKSFIYGKIQVSKLFSSHF